MSYVWCIIRAYSRRAQPNSANDAHTTSRLRHTVAKREVCFQATVLQIYTWGAAMPLTMKAFTQQTSHSRLQSTSVPHNVQQLRSYVGLIHSYHNVLNNISNLIVPRITDSVNAREQYAQSGRSVGFRHNQLSSIDGRRP